MNRLRKMFSWRGLGLVTLCLVSISAVALVTVLVVERDQRIADEESLPMPGRLVDIGTHRMHLWCEGQGSPTVVLDAGAMAFSTSWRSVVDALDGRSRVCAFDRSGLGWSEGRFAVRSAVRW